MILLKSKQFKVLGSGFQPTGAVSRSYSHGPDLSRRFLLQEAAGLSPMVISQDLQFFSWQPQPPTTNHPAHYPVNSPGTGKSPIFIGKTCLETSYIKRPPTGAPHPADPVLPTSAAALACGRRASSPAGGTAIATRAPAEGRSSPPSLEALQPSSCGATGG